MTTLHEQIKEQVVDTVGFMIDLAFMNDQNRREELDKSSMADRIAALIIEKAWSYDTMNSIIYDALDADVIDYDDDFWALKNAAEYYLK